VWVQGFFCLKISEEKFRPTGNGFNFVFGRMGNKKIKK
jgi:hypothetical protein